jgi:hypothetical protein
VLFFCKPPPAFFLQQKQTLPRGLRCCPLQVLKARDGGDARLCASFSFHFSRPTFLNKIFKSTSFESFCLKQAPPPQPLKE